MLKYCIIRHAFVLRVFTQFFPKIFFAPGGDIKIVICGHHLFAVLTHTSIDLPASAVLGPTSVNNNNHIVYHLLCNCQQGNLIGKPFCTTTASNRHTNIRHSTGTGRLNKKRPHLENYITVYVKVSLFLVSKSCIMIKNIEMF